MPGSTEGMLAVADARYEQELSRDDLGQPWRVGARPGDTGPRVFRQEWKGRE